MTRHHTYYKPRDQLSTLQTNSKMAIEPSLLNWSSNILTVTRGSCVSMCGLSPWLIIHVTCDVEQHSSTPSVLLWPGIAPDCGHHSQSEQDSDLRVWRCLKFHCLKFQWNLDWKKHQNNLVLPERLLNSWYIPNKSPTGDSLLVAKLVGHIAKSLVAEVADHQVHHLQALSLDSF